MSDNHDINAMDALTAALRGPLPGDYEGVDARALARHILDALEDAHLVVVSESVAEEGWR